MSASAFLIRFNLRCSSFDSTLSDTLVEDGFDGVGCFLLTAGGVIILFDVIIFVGGYFVFYYIITVVRVVRGLLAYSLIFKYLKLEFAPTRRLHFG